MKLHNSGLEGLSIDRHRALHLHVGGRLPAPDDDGRKGHNDGGSAGDSAPTAE
jgi:hypothetical protein